VRVLAFQHAVEFDPRVQIHASRDGSCRSNCGAFRMRVCSQSDVVATATVSGLHGADAAWRASEIVDATAREILMGLGGGQRGDLRRSGVSHPSKLGRRTSATGSDG